METIKINNHENNKLKIEDRAFHDWYRFVLSFPPHLVRDYLDKFKAEPNSIVLDPFCGTGTTVVECKKLGFASIGVEANPISYFASKVKTNWQVDPEGFLSHTSFIANLTRELLAIQGFSEDDSLPLFKGDKRLSVVLRTLPEESMKLLLRDSISPIPLHKTLVLLEKLNVNKVKQYFDHECLALAKGLVTSIGNLHFGPEVGVGHQKPDAQVVNIWLNNIQEMANDLAVLKGNVGTTSLLYCADARQIAGIIKPESVDIVITSPPYPNEKDYTRSTRLESVLLGFLKNRMDLRILKNDLVRSNTRNVFKGDNDHLHINGNNEIQQISESIENKRIELGKTSGFERLYHRVTSLYFGGMARHLSEMRTVLRPGARLAYVVGDQASYFQIMIRTGKILADIAESLGYEPISIDLFRTRLSTTTKEQLREEVVVLGWPGETKRRSTKMARQQMYVKIIEQLFLSKYEEGLAQIDFDRPEINHIATELKIDPPKNLGDLVYSFRYRAALPKSIQDKAKEGHVWIIRPIGTAKYRFALIPDNPLVPNPAMTTIKIPDATPGIVKKYALDDEQALLAILRYNRLIDIFTGITCYSLQNHLRTRVDGMGQIETDEIYVGLDKKGAQYVLPVQAKGGTDKLNIVQIEQDIAACAQKFPNLICRPIATQFMDEGVISLFEFSEGDNGVGISVEKHYKLVPPKEITDEELIKYGTPSSD